VKPDPHPRITRAVYAALSANPRRLKAEAIAGQLDLNKSTLWRWATQGGIPLHQLLELVKESGDDGPIAAACEEVGGVFLPMRRANGDSETDQQLARTVRECADVVSAVADALVDGRVTPEEAARARRRGTQAMRAIAALIQRVEEQAEKDGG